MNSSPVAVQPDPLRVREYYDYTVPFYRKFWHGDSHAIHYGFGDEKTRNFREHLLNTNKFLAEVAGIGEQDLVLDAGCGVGGSAFWIARHIGARILGITVSARQCYQATRLAERYALTALTRFECRDILDANLPAGAFDVVWAIESACYLQHSDEFARQAYRLLKPGGRLVVGDGFLNRPPANSREDRWLQHFVEGLVLPGLTPVERFPATLRRAGFIEIRSWDKTPDVGVSARRMFRRCSAGYWFSRITERLGFTPPLLTKNNRAGIAQYHLIEHGVASYAVFCALKPPG